MTVKTASMHNFIQQNYEIIFYGEEVNKQDLGSVQEFCLCEIPGSNKANELFLRRFATVEDCVLVETVSRMQMKETVSIDENIPTSCWDLPLGKISPCLSKEKPGYTEWKEELESSWPARTQSMLDSMEKARKKAPHTFVLADATHFMEIDPKLPIKDFLQAIKKRNIVILLPEDNSLKRVNS